MKAFATALSIVLVLVLPLAVSAQTVTQDATVAWTAPTVNAASVTGYDVQKKNTSGTFATVGSTNATTLTYVDANLPQGAIHCYRIIAKSAVGNAVPSGEGCGATAGVPGAAGNPTITITIKSQ